MNSQQQKQKLKEEIHKLETEISESKSKLEQLKKQFENLTKSQVSFDESDEDSELANDIRTSKMWKNCEHIQVKIDGAFKVIHFDEKTQTYQREPQQEGGRQFSLKEIIQMEPRKYQYMK